MKPGDLVIWSTSWSARKCAGIILEYYRGGWGENYYKILLEDGSTIREIPGSSLRRVS